MEAFFDLEEYLNDLREIVNIDSGSRDTEGCARMIRWFASKYGQAGFDVAINGQPGKNPTMEARYCVHKDRGIDVLFTGHVDTVFPKGTAAKRPFSIEEGMGKGPGAADMKSGGLLAFYLARAIRDAGVPVNLCAALNSDEELGSPDSAQWLKDLGKRADYCFHFAGGHQGGAFITRRKGVFDYIIRFKGISAHAGIDPGKGASAIVEMGRWIESVPYLNAPERGTMLNTGMVKGGSASNVIAEEAEMLVELRYTEEKEKQRVERSFSDMASYPKIAGVQTGWSIRAGFPPMEPNQNTENLISILKQAASERGQAEPKFTFSEGGSDANNLMHPGVSVMDGCGPESGFYHSEKEYFVIESVKQRFDLIFAAITKIGALKKIEKRR